MLFGLAQIEILHRLIQEHHSGFRRAAWARTGTTLASASAICLAVEHWARATCFSPTLARTLIAMACAQSCRFLNSQISETEN